MRFVCLLFVDGALVWSKSRKQKADWTAHSLQRTTFSAPFIRQSRLPSADRFMFYLCLLMFVHFYLAPAIP